MPGIRRIGSPDSRLGLPGARTAPSAAQRRPEISELFSANVRHPALRPETVRGPTEQIDCFTGDAAVQCSSMMAKRVIPCLDVHDGKVTRGVQFGVAEGRPAQRRRSVELALRYNEQGADEMVFFDITATAHGRGTMVDVIERAADQCFMPLTVGGGIKSVDDMHMMLRAGADKISINSSALANPDLIRQGAEKFGSQCIVVSD